MHRGREREKGRNTGRSRPESGSDAINLPQNPTPRSNRSHRRTKGRRGGGGEMGGCKRDGDGEGQGVGRQTSRGQRGEV